MSKPKIKAKVLDLNEIMDTLRGRANDGGKKKGAADSLMEVLGDEVPKEVRDAVSEIIDSLQKDEPEEFTQKIEAQAELMEYMAQPMPMVGDFVERNKFGMLRYRSPEGDAESAMVLEVFPTYLQEAEGRGAYNGLVAFCNRAGVVRVHVVDLRLYKTVEPAKANAGTTH